MHSWQSYLLTIHIYCANISQSQLTNVAATILTSGDQATVARDPSPWRRRCDAEFLSCFHPSGTLQTKQVPLQLWLRKLSGNFYTASTWHRVCGLLKIFGSVSFLKPINPKSPTKSTFDNLCFSSLFCKEFVVRGVYPKLKRYFAQDGGQVVGASFTLYTIYALRCIGRFFQHFFLLTQPIIRVSIRPWRLRLLFISRSWDDVLYHLYEMSSLTFSSSSEPVAVPQTTKKWETWWNMVGVWMTCFASCQSVIWWEREQNTTNASAKNFSWNLSETKRVLTWIGQECSLSHGMILSPVECQCASPDLSSRVDWTWARIAWHLIPINSYRTCQDQIHAARGSQKTVCVLWAKSFV